MPIGQLQVRRESGDEGRGRRVPDAPHGADHMPSSGRAMGILLIIGIVDFVVRCGMMMASGAPPANAAMSQAMVGLIGAPFSFVIHLAMLSSLLPTSLGRAFVVRVVQVLIVVVFCLVIGDAAAAVLVGLAHMH